MKSNCCTCSLKVFPWWGLRCRKKNKSANPTAPVGLTEIGKHLRAVSSSRFSLQIDEETPIKGESVRPLGVDPKQKTYQRHETWSVKTCAKKVSLKQYMRECNTYTTQERPNNTDGIPLGL